MNALLIYPAIPDTFWSFKYALKFIGKRAAFPPLGLLTVAALLPGQWQKRCVDLNVARLTDKDIAWADYVFISAMSVQLHSAEAVIKRCRNSGTPVVAGGPLFTCQPERFPHVDYLVLNEAELTLPQFLHDLDRGLLQHIYRTGEFFDLGACVSPQLDLIDFRHYAELSVQYSRGCPFNCDFCNVTSLFGHRPRVKPADRVMRELELCYSLGYRGSIFFVDDNFIGNKARVKRELLPALIRWRRTNPGITFHTEASIDLADDKELMHSMVEAGFDMVFVGIETPDADSLAECGKLQNRNRDMVADVHRMQQAGLQVQGGFIVGFDHDETSVFQRQIEFIQKSGIVTAMVGLLQAVPGTKLYERLWREGRLAGDTTGDNVDGTTNIIPRMDVESLYTGYRRVMEEIYRPKQYYRRIKAFLENYRAPPLGRPITAERFKAFLRSMVRLGIVGRERVQYWRLMIWTFIRRRELMPLAVTLAIHGHHFRRTVRRHIRREHKNLGISI